MAKQRSLKMAPRRKSIGGLRNSSNVSDKENNYLRSLNDYQARVRRRESIRNCKNVAECDLEERIELESKIKEGSTKLLAAARHPSQTLEAARAFLTSTKRMAAYALELQQRKRAYAASKTSESESENKSKSRGKLFLSDLRFPLMWRDSDHFKNRGDHRRFAVFCIARVGADVHDTGLLYPVDREQTDITFPDVLSFDNVQAEFELYLEVYSHVLEEDLSIASTPRRIRRSIRSSISKTVGRKLAASLRDDDETDRAPRFDLVARAKMTLDDTDADVRSYDLSLSSLRSKVHALPLFAQFCCRLAVRPYCVDEQPCVGRALLNGQPLWLCLQPSRLAAWKSKERFDESEEATCTIPISKETIVRRSKSTENQFKLTNIAEDNERRHVIRLNSNEEAEKWLKRVTECVQQHTRWKHAVTSLQPIPSSENVTGTLTIQHFSNDKTKRQVSLYEETLLTEAALPSAILNVTASGTADSLKRSNLRNVQQILWQTKATTGM